MEKEFDRLNAAISSYYNSLEAGEIAEETNWGAFAESQLPAEE